ncbi:DUF1793-domain-containing protein [Mycena belliarum]|uniref:DUF1793-domain-containing protein n=1 Tax=Mycena belliarum TaxID=1033014 RepID=A0AAD6TYF6_9AGAR|nr:DUF1793-domain-containing protein [Mycena belliae]
MLPQPLRTALLALALALALAPAALAAPGWRSTPFSPPSIPLAVRSPYLSAWLPQGGGTPLNGAWPQFWAGQTVAWTGLARVDGAAYSFLGVPSVPGANYTRATQKSFEFTATQSIFVLAAGPVDLTVTFLSPVETDYAKLSTPLAYMHVAAAATDGAPHRVQLYSDVSAEWVSGADAWDVEWATTGTDSDTDTDTDTATDTTTADTDAAAPRDVVRHEVKLASPAPYEEVNDQIQYGSLHYAILDDRPHQKPTPPTTTTFQTGQDTLTRGAFLRTGALPNTRDGAFRAVGASWPVFALARDLGVVGGSPASRRAGDSDADAGNSADAPPDADASSDSTSTTAHAASALFAIGHIRDPAVRYAVGAGRTQARSLFFWSRGRDVGEVISAFLHDYAPALARARALDARIARDAGKVSAAYAGLVALSVRQAVGACELTIARDAAGRWDERDVMLFMKEISSDGNLNTVDVIFPATPLFLYLFPALGQALLEPLFRYQAAGLYPNKWSVHDMGAHYPKAAGHPDGEDEAMPVEESGNMLIMALSYARASGDLTQIRRYRALLDQWTQFLIEDSLIPTNQLSTDDFAGRLANQTNLAIKGIIGIRAMAEIEALLGDTAKAANYTAIAADYVKRWQVLSASTTGPHLTLAYGQSDSWGLAYNLFSDVHLKFNLFPKAVYDQQTAWYKTKINQYGIPLDTRHTYSKTDWLVWTAGIVTDDAVRAQIIAALAAFAANGLNNVPLSDLYDTVSGLNQGFRARPVVGGHLALMLL